MGPADDQFSNNDGIVVGHEPNTADVNQVIEATGTNLRLVKARLAKAEAEAARLQAQLDAEHATKLGRAVLAIRRVVIAVLPVGTGRRTLVGRALSRRRGVGSPAPPTPIVVSRPDETADSLDEPDEEDAHLAAVYASPVPGVDMADREIGDFDDRQPAPSTPGSIDARVQAEIDFFRNVSNVADLPAIFSVWADNFLLPKLQSLGYGSIDDVFVAAVLAYRDRSGNKSVRIVSLGAGNCDNEVRFAQLLLAEGLSNFTIECLELSEFMIERAEALVAESGLANHIEIVQANLNEWVRSTTYDVFIANHSLHHVVELERLFAYILRSMSAEGIFLVNDMIGRNGHMRWPEALGVVEAIWETMPRRYKYNHPLSRWEEKYENWDCSVVGFEGIRAEDILPLLLKNFDFDVFIGFGNVANIFVDRAFGHNLDPENPEDVRFIRRVGELDDALIDLGVVKPTQMVGVLRKRGTATALSCYQGWTPEFCVRVPES